MSEVLRLNLIIGLAVALLVLIAALLHRTVGLGPYLEGTTVTLPVMHAGVVRDSSFGHPRRGRHQAVRLVQVDHQGKALAVPVGPDAEIGPQMTVRLGAPGARVPAMLQRDYEVSLSANRRTLTITGALAALMAAALAVVPPREPPSLRRRP